MWLRSCSANSAQLKKGKWRRTLLYFVARATDCQAISRRAGRPGVWRYQLGLIGSGAGRQVCSQLFGYLEEAIECLAHEAVAGRKAIGVYSPPSYRQNFSEGAAVRLALRLEAETKRRQAEGMIFEDGTITDAGAIVHVHQSAMEAIDRFCENQGLTDAPSIKFDADRDGFFQGHQAAEAIGLAPQLQEAI